MISRESFFFAGFLLIFCGTSLLAAEKAKESAVPSPTPAKAFPQPKPSPSPSKAPSGKKDLSPAKKKEGGAMEITGDNVPPGPSVGPSEAPSAVDISQTPPSLIFEKNGPAEYGPAYGSETELEFSEPRPAVPADPKKKGPSSKSR